LLQTSFILQTKRAQAPPVLRAGAKAKIKGIKLDLSKKCLHLNAQHLIFLEINLFMPFMRVGA